MGIGTGTITRHARAGFSAAVLALVGVIAVSTIPVNGRQEPQKAEAAKKDEPLPLKPERTATFTVSEGTWISLDVSPDGQTIVFELLGDLYKLPIGGGKATRLTDGPGYDAQPRYSPDGTQIAFVSDRDGGEHVWLVASDGTGARALTRGTNTRFQSPDWTSDGHLLVSKGRSTGFGTVYDQRGYDLLMFYLSGGTGLKVLPVTPSGPPAAGAGAAASSETIMGAAVGKDPRHIYAAVNRPAPGSAFANWQIVRFDRQTGQSFGLTSGSAFRPLVSPDERYLVYATRDDAVTRLRVRDLESGDETWLTGPVTRDEAESIYSRDLMPGSAFLPDGRSIVTSYGGKIWRVEVPSGKATAIPFTADVEMGIAPAARFDYTIADGELTAKQIRYPVVSPDGKRLAFTALNRVWVVDLPGGTPKRLTDATAGEHWPAWSPDGRSIAFVTWSDSEGGDIYRIAADGTGPARRLTARSAYYDRVSFTPDGSRLVFVRGRKQARIEGETDTLQLAWMPSDGGEITTVAPTSAGMTRPHFGPDSSRIFLFTAADGLFSVRFDGTDRRSTVKFGSGPAETVSMAVLSPKGDRAVALLRNQVYLVTVPMAGDAPTIAIGRPADAAVPVKKVTKIGGDFVAWNRDGTAFHYALGRFFFSYDIAAAEAMEGTGTAAAAAEGDTPRGEAKGKERPTYDPPRVEVKVTAKRDVPEGIVVLRGARILTMAPAPGRPGGASNGGPVIENGDIVVTNNRITAVGPRGSVAIPAGARTIDVSGKTIVPGWIDIHAHMSSPGGVLRTQQWEFATNLAYGVTTTRNPQTGSTDVLAYEDLVEIGEMAGPRILSTGPGIFAAENITSLDEARNVLRRYSEYYGTQYIKQYRRRSAKGAAVGDHGGARAEGDAGHRAVLRRQEGRHRNAGRLHRDGPRVSDLSGPRRHPEGDDRDARRRSRRRSSPRSAAPRRTSTSTRAARFTRTRSCAVSGRTMRWTPSACAAASGTATTCSSTRITRRNWRRWRSSAFR